MLPGFLPGFKVQFSSWGLAECSSLSGRTDMKQGSWGWWTLISGVDDLVPCLGTFYAPSNGSQVTRRLTERSKQF